MAFRFRRPNWKTVFSWNTLVWVIVIALPLTVLMNVNSTPSNVMEVTYSSFLDRLDRGKVSGVSFQDDNSQLVADLKAPLDTLGGHIQHLIVALPVRNSDELVKRIESAGAAIRVYHVTPSIFDVLRALLPYIFMGGLFWFIFSKMQGARASFGVKGKEKMISEVPSVKFADMAGAEEAKGELQEIVEFLKDPTLVTRLGGAASKGALLIGPPGTGKTLLARAVAGEAGRPFFSMSGSDFVEMFVGVGAARVRSLFEQARAQAPCIVFIDEIDAVGRRRTGAGSTGSTDEREQTLNQLLVEMDGFSNTQGIVVLAATNRPDVLDPALLRPGRFDRQVTIDPPDVKGREAILRVHMAKLVVEPDVDVAKIARGTPGMTGADLANVCNEAAMLAARRKYNSIGMREFEDARDKIMLGLERRSLVLSDFERKLTAYHEAGHALVALAIPGSDPIHKVTIIPRGRALGITASMPDVDRHAYTKGWITGHLAMLYGGRAAEEIVLGDDQITTGAQNDILRATDMARRMVTEWGFSALGAVALLESGGGDPVRGGDTGARAPVSDVTMTSVDSEVRAILEAAHNRARTILRDKRDDLEVLAQALLEKETISREDIEELLPHLHPKLAVGPRAESGVEDIAPEQSGQI